MQIPVIDFSSYDPGDPDALAALAGEIREALTGIGFVSLKNIGIPQDLRDEVFAAAAAFFSQEDGEKRKLGYSDAETNFGYQGICEESLHPGAPPDLKEALTLRDLEKHIDFDWPDPALRDLLLHFYGECMAAAYRVLRVFALSLELPTEFFVERHQGENVTLRVLHYPPLQATQPGQLGAGAHTDYGMLTLLFQDSVGGLEVRDREGHWQPVTPDPEAVVINAGDLLQCWTNERYRSSLHRVQPRAGAGDRYSIAFFVDPDSDTRVECLPSCTDADNPPRFEPVTAGEHILAKIRATHLTEAAGDSP